MLAVNFSKNIYSGEGYLLWPEEIKQPYEEVHVVRN